MTASDIVEAANFHALLIALGFQRPKRGTRTQCALCNAKNPTTFSFDTNRGLWHCFRCGSGGGVLDLVQAVNGGDRRSALQWLADFVGLPLNGHALTPTARRAWRRKRQRAESLARNLTGWRQRVLQRLEDERNHLWDSENIASAWARMEIAEPSGKHEVMWSHVWRHAHDDVKAVAIDEEIRRIESATPTELVAIRCEWEAAAA